MFTRGSVGKKKNTKTLFPSLGFESFSLPISNYIEWSLVGDEQYYQFAGYSIEF